MIVKKKKLSDNKIQSLGKVVSMKFDAGSESEIFDILTDGLYSDPIGSIVREITTNCFDAHIEAGNDTPKNPVLVKLTKEVSGNFISFIDNGVGMSPDRVYNVYGTYLKSTKDDSNAFHGGFGLGGKTPLTYTKSFFAVTRKDGIQYTYNVFEGDDSPKIELLSQESTKEGNGTEIKIPVLESDIREFEQSTLRQLYYFENIIFEGFSDKYVTNDYKIIRGKTFVYRGESYDNYMHVCFGKVAYPIAYETLGLEQSDYAVPVAVQIEIGELDGTGVTRSREQLKYTPKNREILIKKMNAVKQELSDMLGKQMDNVQTIEQYYDAMKNYSILNLTKDVSLDLEYIVEKNDIVLPNFKYDDISMPSYNGLIDMFYGVKRFGKKETKRGTNYTHRTFEEIKDRTDIVHTTGEFKRKVLKQSFLQHYNQRFYLHTPKDFSDVEDFNFLKRKLGLTILEDYKIKSKPSKATDAMGNLIDDGTRQRVKYLVPKKKGDQLTTDFIGEVHALMAKYAIDYDQLVVPESYKELRKKDRISTDMLKDAIKAKLMGSNGWSSNRTNIKFKEYVEFKGTIYYGFRDDESDLKQAARIALDISGDDAISDTYYSTYNGGTGFKGMLFPMIAKGTEKHFKLLGKKAMHVKYFYHTYLSRKVDKIVESMERQNITSIFDDNVHEFFKKSTFKDIDSEIADNVHLVKDAMEGKTLKTYGICEWKFNEVFGFRLEDVKGKFVHQDKLDELVRLTDNNSNKLKYLDYPHSLDVDNDAHKHFIELVSLSIDK